MEAKGGWRLYFNKAKFCYELFHHRELVATISREVEAVGDLEDVVSHYITRYYRETEGCERACPSCGRRI